MRGVKEGGRKGRSYWKNGGMEKIHTMAIEILALAIPINSNVRVQTQHLAAPEFRPVFCRHGLSIDFPFCDERFEARLLPQSPRKLCVCDLEAVVHPYGVAAFRLAGGGDEGQGSEKGDVFGTERGREEVGDCDYLVLG